MTPEAIQDCLFLFPFTLKNSHNRALHICCLVTKLSPTLFNPMDYSPPGSSVHGIFQARILEWVAISCSRGIFSTQASNPVSGIACISRWVLCHPLPYKIKVFTQLHMNPVHLFSLFFSPSTFCPFNPQLYSILAILTMDPYIFQNQVFLLSVEIFKDFEKGKRITE